MIFSRHSNQQGERPELKPVDEAEYTFFPTVRCERVVPGEMRYVEIGAKEEPICLINLDGSFFAISDTCTHEEASLSDGEISGDEIECPLHGGAFDIRTGTPVAFPVVVPATIYPCRVVEGIVEIGLKNQPF